MSPEKQLQGNHRLAVLGGGVAIAQEVRPQLTKHWLAIFRFLKIRQVSLQTLELNTHAKTLVHLVRAKRILGEMSDALEHYHTALNLQTKVGNWTRQAVTLANIGAVYDGLGEWQQALHYFQQALPIQQAVGDRVGLAVTLNNLGMVYHGLG